MAKNLFANISKLAITASLPARVFSIKILWFGKACG